MKNAIIASTSTVFGGEYLDYLTSELKELFKNTDTILFIPYARPGGISQDDYTNKVKIAFDKIDKKVVGIHEFSDAKDALINAKGIFTGGGNTFLLVQQLYENDVMETLKNVINNGTPYLGTSAGSNITGVSMQTTNDMPIVYPPSFKTLEIIPFNLNPHYLDPEIGSTHMGETRETRINEFHTQNNIPVIGLREGSWLEVKNEKILLKGNLTARYFNSNEAAIEINPETDFSKL
jgi:dipeptidase E